MKLHIDSFQYSEEMENYFSCYKRADDFSKSFINSEFRLAVANIVIALHHGNVNEARSSLEMAKRITRFDYVGRLRQLLARHRYEEALDTTPEALAFINTIKI
jgi:hypothetical protein